MRDFVLFFLIILSLTERIFSLKIGPMDIGLFDIALVFSFLYLLVKNKIVIKRLYLFFILYYVLSNIFIFIFINDEVSFTSIISVPLKLILVSYLANKIVLSKKYVQIAVITFSLLILGLITISDGGISDIHLLNRNETISYLLALIFLLPDSRNKLRLYLIFLLLISSFIVQSRQLVIGITFSSLIYGFIYFKKSLKYIPVLLVFGFLSVTLFNYYYSGLDSYNKRRYEFSSIEDRTRGDRIRYLNILWGLENSTNSIFIGHGSGSYVRLNPYNKVAHNSYITLLFENGIIGLGLFIFLLIDSKPMKSDKMSFYIFFIMVAQLFFIESIGKFAIYLYFLKSNHSKKNKIK